MNMNEWLSKIRKEKKSMPILSFPAIQLLNISVEDMLYDADIQADCMKAIVDKYDSLAALGLMDLSVEAECFGSNVKFHSDEVPTVIGSIISSFEQAQNLKVPHIGAGRTKTYIEAIRKSKEIITDRPVLAGVIGPFSLAGRLLDVSEAMIYCYEEPEMVHIVLEKVTEFIINYIDAYKAVGADGVVMAEPLGGILSPTLSEVFSTYYVDKIVTAVQDDDFLVIYHNCGNNTPKMIDQYINTNIKVFHFGNAVNITDILDKMPNDRVIMGNIDPAGEFRNGTVESITNVTKDLLYKTQNYDNFIISSGCDIPPLSKLENIEAFMHVCKEFYENNS